MPDAVFRTIGDTDVVRNGLRTAEVRRPFIGAKDWEWLARDGYGRRLARDRVRLLSEARMHAAQAIGLEYPPREVTP